MYGHRAPSGRSAGESCRGAALPEAVAVSMAAARAYVYGTVWTAGSRACMIDQWELGSLGD